MRTRIKTCSLRTAIARWVARRLVPVVFPQNQPPRARPTPLATARTDEPARHRPVLRGQAHRQALRDARRLPPRGRRRARGVDQRPRRVVAEPRARRTWDGRPLRTYRSRARRCRAGVCFYPARGERRGGQARAGIPRPPAPRHDARPASGDRPPAYLADPRNRPLPRPSPARRSYRVRVRTAGVRCARMIVWVPADAGMTKKRGGGRW